MASIYHRDIYLPSSLIEDIPNNLQLKWCKHSHTQWNNRYYYKIPPIRTICFSHSDIVEYSEEDNGRKILVRIPFLETQDLCIVILITSLNNLVKTIWFNNKNDKHKTLKTGNYIKPHG